MYIKKVLVLSLFLCLTVSSVYASNIGRTVYGVFAESATGTHFDGASSDADSVVFEFWNDEWTHYVNTMTSTEKTAGVVEGLVYSRLTFVNPYTCGWGASVIRSSNSSGYKNMSEYYNGKVKFLARVTPANAKALNCKVGLILNSDTAFYVGTLSDLGLQANNTWTELSFNLKSSVNSNITTTNLAKTKALIVFMQDSNVTTDLFFDVDYIRWIKPNSTGSFNVTVKKVSDNSTVSTNNITWASSNFQTGWKVAEQYLEIDYDKDSSTRDWNVKLYVNNGSKSKNGLYATKAGKDYVMTMCWRASEKTLPYTDGNGAHTLQIAKGEGTDDSGEKYDYLYDSGSNSTTYAPWLFMQDLTALETDKDKDYSTVMSYHTGYHGYSGVYGGPHAEKGYYAGSKVALYLGADCNAAGGLKYQGNILVVLEYE